MQSANKIVYNTAILYGQMVITILVSLYSTRLVLKALGAPDFGLFNVIAGVIGMLAFLNAAMTTSTQRYLSYNHGANNSEKIKVVYANSAIIHFILAVVLVLVFETAGLYFLESKLNISIERLEVAKWLFHFAVISTFISIISVPYDGVINSHENMIFIAVTNVIESILKLFLAIYLLTTGFDRLLTYGLVIMLITILMRLIKRYYCRKYYEECRTELLDKFDKKVSTDLISFAGWNLFGVLCYLFRNQGVAVVMNLFFGTVTNAAYAIGNQVNGQLSFFSQTMMKSIRPQMMKSEGAGDRSKMLRLADIAGKFSFYLFSIFSIPLFIKMPLVLQLWLGEVPENTVQFCRLILILTLIQQLSVGIMTATQAIGKIRLYQTVAGSIQLLTLPIGYVFFYYGYQASSILIVAIVLEIIASIFRIVYYEYLTSYSSIKFLKENILLPLAPCLLTYSLFTYLSSIISSEIFSVIVVFLGSIIFYAALIFSVGINKQERNYVVNMIIGVKKKLIH